MLDLTKLDDDILDALRERGHDDQSIAEMTPLKAMEEYCDWNGLIHWGRRLFKTVETLKKAKTNKKSPQTVEDFIALHVNMKRGGYPPQEVIDILRCITHKGEDVIVPFYMKHVNMKRGGYSPQEVAHLIRSIWED